MSGGGFPYATIGGRTRMVMLVAVVEGMWFKYAMREFFCSLSIIHFTPCSISHSIGNL